MILILSPDTLKTTTPLVTKVILAWLTDSFTYFHATELERAELGLKKPRGIGYGIGLAVALFVMQGAFFMLHRGIVWLNKLSQRRLVWYVYIRNLT